MNKKILLAALTALFFTISLSAQFNITWQQTYGFADKSENAKAVHAFADGSAIVGVARNTNDGGPLGNTRAEIFKYDATGNTVWQTTLGGPENDNLQDLIVDPNGNILTVGQNYRPTMPDTRSDMWVVKMNSAGTVLWEKQIGGSSYDSGRSIIATSDGGYLVLGSTQSEDGIINNRFNKPTSWIVKLDADGNVQWNRTYGGYGVYDDISKAVETPQGDFIIGAAAFGFGEDVPATNGDYDFWIFKINSIGDIIWSKNYGGLGPEFVRSINLLPNGSMIISGNSNSHATGDVSRLSASNTNFWVIKLDAAGGLVWEKSIGGDFFENGGFSDVSPSGEIYLAGTSNSLNGDITQGYGERDIWVFRLDSDGNILDKKNFGGSEFENANDLDLNGNHLFIAGGTGSSDGDVAGFSGGRSGDAWVLNLTIPTAPPTGCNPDLTPPVWSNCPIDITVSNGSPTQVNWTPPTAADACSFADFTSNFTSNYIFPLGSTRVIYTSTDEANNVSTCEFNVTVQPQTGGDVDLELSVIQNDANPTQWGYYTITATLNNTGSQAANNVEVEWLSPNGVAYQGGNEYTASQGSFEHWGNQIWTVGTIPAGGSATLEVSYFLLNPTAPVSYAQVSSMSGTDIDSTPGNGTCCSANEDDEASTNDSNPPPSGKPDLEITNVQIPTSIQAGSTFNAQITARNNGTVAFNQPTLIQALVSFGIVEIKSTPTLNLAPGASQTFTLPFTMLGFNIARQETMQFNIDILDTIDESNETNNNFDVDFQLTVSNPGGGIDLELSLVQNDANPRQWNNYTVTATLNNTGSQAANNVEVEWLSPNGVTYQGGNEYTSSQGTFKYYSDQIWSVGTIPAGGAATMEVSYFLLQPNAPTAYAQVSAMSGTDADSTPANGTCCTPNEDDEASTSGGVAPINQPDLTLSNLSLGVTTVAQGNILNYNFNLQNIGNEIAADNYQIKAYISTDQTLDANDAQDGIVPTGNTAAGANILVPGASRIPANLPQGDYYLILVADDGNAITESNESNNTIVSTNTFTVQSTTPPPTAVAPKKTVKVLVIMNDPVYQGQRFHQRFNWLNPTTLVNNLRDSMTAVSRGSVEYVIEAIEYDDNIYTTLNSNLVPNVQTMAGYFEEPAWATLKQFEAVGQVRFDYNGFIDNNDLCTRFDAAEYDDVWLYSYPIAGLWESTLAGKDAFWYNSQPVPSTSCLGLLPIMGFNYERGLPEAMHSYGHRSESAMRQEYGRWDYNATNPNDWEKFTYYDARKPGQAQVGNIHFPPNGTSDYDYGNTQIVSCQADQWYDYPNGTAPARNCDCSEWGCSHLGYMAWWYRHLPNKDCLNPSGQLNDWWHYIIDYNQAQVREQLLNGYGCDNPPTATDFIIKQFNSITELAPSDSYLTSLSVRNKGLAHASNSRYSAFLSTDETIDASDIEIGYLIIPPLRSGVEVDGQMNITIPQNTAPGNYSLIFKIDSENQYAENSETNNERTVDFTVTGTPPPGNGADLSMSIVTTTDIPQWANWSVTYVITNGSATTATGVKAQMQKPDQVVYTGGNEFNTAQGTFDLYGTETWDVGSIGPGDQAVFTANYFRVSADPFTLYGQVTASDQSDPDSTPGNGSCCIANEDDEAARSLLAAFSGVNNRTLAFETDKSQLTFMQSVFPNPTSEAMTVRMIAKEASQTEIQVIDNFGRILISDYWQLEQGVNEKTIDLSNYPAGLYQVIAQPFHPYLRKARVMKVGE